MITARGRPPEGDFKRRRGCHRRRVGIWHQSPGPPTGCRGTFGDRSWWPYYLSRRRPDTCTSDSQSKGPAQEGEGRRLAGHRRHDDRSTRPAGDDHRGSLTRWFTTVCGAVAGDRPRGNRISKHTRSSSWQPTRWPPTSGRSVGSGRCSRRSFMLRASKPLRIRR